MPEGSLDDYLPPDEFRRVADVRRAVWTGGFRGAIGGSAAGLTAYYVCKTTKIIRVKRIHAIPLVAGMGAFCSFIGSFGYGVTAMETFDMHSVLRKNKEQTEDRHLSSYQRSLAEQGREEEIRQEQNYGRKDPWSQGGNLAASAEHITQGSKMLAEGRTWQEIREENRQQKLREGIRGKDV